MKNNVLIAILVAALLVGGASYLATPNSAEDLSSVFGADTALAARFELLRGSSNSSCSALFVDSIDSMGDGQRLRGSCCSPMSAHRYKEQVEGLQKFKSNSGQNVTEIPDDPYNIDAALAKRLKGYYDLELTPAQQEAYNYAMQNSMERGPCCCKCWRWFVYGGLAKYLITNHGFTGEQVTEVWNLSDGCGGDEEHHH